mgnify:CR=1 FL=1
MQCLNVLLCLSLDFHELHLRRTCVEARVQRQSDGEGSDRHTQAQTPRDSRILIATRQQDQHGTDNRRRTNQYGQ